MSNSIILGAGDIWVKPATGTAPNPVRIATCKKISINISKNVIEQTGAYEFPLDVAGGAATLKGTLDIAGFESGLVGAVFSGTTVSTGYTAMAVDEVGAVPSGSGYTVTVTNASGGITDYGVLYSDGSPLTRGATATAAGIYAVNEATGVYTFHSGDASKSVKISYEYAVAGSGSTVDIKSALIGSSPSYILKGWNTYSGKKIGYRFPTVKLTGLKFDLAADKHVEPSVDFSAFALPGASVFTMFFS